MKRVKMKISKNKKMRFFLMSQGSYNPKIRFLGQKVCPVARLRTDTQTDTKVNTVEDTLSGFQKFFLQPIIKERSKNDIKYVKCTLYIPEWHTTVEGFQSATKSAALAATKGHNFRKSPQQSS